MPLDTFVGWPQIAAVAILVQRGLEELHSARNTSRLIGRGAYEVGAEFYPVVAITHLSWIAALAFLIPPDSPLILPLLVFYILLQVARYWIILSLGEFWTHRILTLDNAPIVKRGPYRFVRHPNYIVTATETLILPWVFGAWALGLIIGAVWAAVLVYKIRLEDAALGSRRAE